jgi:glycosyltransferase involved in cell wall biosynthesis
MATAGRSVISTDTRQIHILSVIDDLHFGGDEYRLHAFGSYLDRTRFRHSVATVVKEDRVLGEQYGSMRDQYRQSGIRLLDLGFKAVAPTEHSHKSTVKRILSAKEKVSKLASLIREEQVDVLDVHLSPANPICALAAMRSRTPFAVTLYQINQMQSRKLWCSGQFNLGAASQLITDSEAQAKCVREWLVRNPPMCVIPNGTAPPMPSIAREKMLRFFKIANRDQPIVIGQVSSLVPYKGQLVVIEAARRVLDQHPNCIFLLVGYERAEKGYKDLLHQRAAELGISNYIRIAGYPGAIGDVWNIIDIHVHASLLDSLPNALLEAMSLGKPSVITSVGGIPEVVQHGSNGLLVAPGNSEQLAKCLLMVLRDSQLRETIGSSAQSCHFQNFGPEQMTRRLEGVFTRLAIGHKKALMGT